MVKEQFRGYPVFYGQSDEDAQDFWETFQACCVADHKVTDNEKKEALAIIVRKQALLWYKGLPSVIGFKKRDRAALPRRILQGSIFYGTLEVS